MISNLVSGEGREERESTSHESPPPVRSSRDVGRKSDSHSSIKRQDNRQTIVGDRLDRRFGERESLANEITRTAFLEERWLTN